MMIDGLVHQRWRLPMMSACASLGILNEADHRCSVHRGFRLDNHIQCTINLRTSPATLSEMCSNLKSMRSFPTYKLDFIQ
jgi:hypothetical protein